MYRYEMYVRKATLRCTERLTYVISNKCMLGTILLVPGYQVPGTRYPGCNFQVLLVVDLKITGVQKIPVPGP